MATYRFQSSSCGRVPRRTFLADIGMGFTGLALGAMLQRDGFASDAANMVAAQRPAAFRAEGEERHLAVHDRRRKPSRKLRPEAGSQQVRRKVDRRDAVQRRAGQEVPRRKRPHRSRPTCERFCRSSIRCRSATASAARAASRSAIGGRTSAVASTTSPSSARCGRNDIDHGAQLQFHTGRNRLDGFFPTIGSWVHYGLGTLNENLPQFVVMGNPVGRLLRRSGNPPRQLPGPGARRRSAGGRPGQSARLRPPGRTAFFAKSRKPNSKCSSGSTGSRWPNIRTTPRPWRGSNRTSWPFACSGRSPKCSSSSTKRADTHKLYGLDNDTTAPFAKHCLAARRLVERGVRFVQIYHGGNGNAGGWDAHGGLLKNHGTNCAQVDKPIAALIRDLKQRGMLDETLVVWATEFGRSPGTEGPLGIPATPEFIAGGHGSTMCPAWLAPLTRPLIVALGLVLALTWWLRGGSGRNRDDALLVLALALLLRCMLDPWDLVYYHLPLVVALAAWEAVRGRGLPVLATVVTAACWISFEVYDARTGIGPYVVYLAWTLPLGACLGIALFRPAAARRTGARRRLVPAPA